MNSIKDAFTILMILFGVSLAGVLLYSFMTMSSEEQDTIMKEMHNMRRYEVL